MTDTELTNSADAVPAADSSAVSPANGLPAAAPVPQWNVEPRFRVRNPSTLIGPALWIHGALLWAFVVLGELVVFGKFPEPLAWLIVLAVFGRTWFVAVRHLAGSRTLFRRIASGILALVVYLVAVAFTTAILGGGGQSGIEAVTIALWFLAVASYAFGRRITRAPRPPPTEYSRPLALAFWALSGVTTFIALLSALGRM